MTPLQLLEAHANRKVGAFILAPDPDSKVVDAFWALIYDGAKVAVDHETAIAIEHELLIADKRVIDVLKGWRPESLAWAARARGGDA